MLFDKMRWRFVEYDVDASVAATEKRERELFEQVPLAFWLDPDLWNTKPNNEIARQETIKTVKVKNTAFVEAAKVVPVQDSNGLTPKLKDDLRDLLRLLEEEDE